MLILSRAGMERVLEADGVIAAVDEARRAGRGAGLDLFGQAKVRV